MKNAYNRIDRSTYSNPTEVLSTVVHLEWSLDFNTNTISGSVTHSMVVVGQHGAEYAKFDSSSLNIVSVEVNSHPVQYTLGESSKALGQCLVVPIPDHLKSVGDEFDVKFNYSASPNASAAQWLSAKATRSGNHPFLFTQCQAIHARSLFPCQDTPGVKTTYTAIVKAPAWARVLMSALEETPANAAKGTTHWRQPVPTPAYLVALAAGELDCKAISSRVKVWAEPSALEAAAFEFSQTEEFLATAESLTCPYVWGRYDILCLPPSFPYGGMENPCLTFATPTLLAGDKSLADVIAHEIAHSWTGNLVTNCTWEHFWLNEGWTVWLERKIMSRVRGDASFLKLSSEIGWKALRDSVTQMNSGKFTELVWPLENEDPDDAFSSVPYEKGFNFLYHLESIVGTLAFEEFAKKYIVEHKFRVVSSGEFKDFFLGHFGGNPEVDAIDWDEFFYSTGMPKVTPNFTNNLSTKAIVLADQWIGWFRENIRSAWKGGPGDMEGWTSQQKCVFLEKLLLFSKDNGPLSLEILESLDLAYGLTSSGNSEIKFRWQTLCLESDAPWIVPHVISFVKSQGRMKFVRPLYRSLHQSGVGAGIARSTFIENNEIYHPIARKMIAQDLGVNLDNSSSQSTSTSSTSKNTNTINPKPIKILQSDPAPVDSSSGCDWFPWILAAGAVGLTAALVLSKKK